MADRLSMDKADRRSTVKDEVAPVTLSREDTSTIAEKAAAAADEVLEAADSSEPLLDLTDEEGQNSTIGIDDEADIIKNLTEGARDQADMERDISHNATIALNEQEDERDNKRINRAKNNQLKLINQREKEVRRLRLAGQNITQKRHIQNEVAKLENEIKEYEDEIKGIRERMESRQKDNEVEAERDDQPGGAEHRLEGESQRDFLIRTGKITPFDRMPRRYEGQEDGLGGVLRDAEEELEFAEHAEAQDGAPRSHQDLKRPGFTDATIIPPDAASEFGLRNRKKRSLQDVEGETSNGPARSNKKRRASDDDSFTSEVASLITDDSAVDDDDNDMDGIIDSQRPRKRTKPSKNGAGPEIVDLSGVDDGDENTYQARLQDWIQRREQARLAKQEEAKADGQDFEEEMQGDEVYKPSPDGPDHLYDHGLRLPADIYSSLFDYQKTGVKWLGELYNIQVGGILGDEMGLGKTIQAISFLAGLHHSKKLKGPVIVVAPATVLRQWVNEFHVWWPPLRVSILHSSGSGMVDMTNESRFEEEERLYRGKEKAPPKGMKAARGVVDRVVKQGHVLVTTYAGLQTYADIIVPVKWDYAVLDEGHKIRNPNTKITVAAKELQTHNRIILSGTPMQNNLTELWSLFDFVYPMRLGTLQIFKEKFEVPIKLGGYANATNLQIMTADKCAETLKDAISPYLLQRVKASVATDLPKKFEKVLFCKLTKPQREAYEVFLASDEMTAIMNRTRQSLYGIDILRKICNHPDLTDKSLKTLPGYKWGNPNKSGKMIVVKALLQAWKRAGDKVLLFSQGVQMLEVIENYVRKMEGTKYLRMDGSTNIKDRQTLVDRFNRDPEIDVFLLTTKVGGLGVNLTGANRVIIFDPDWNPATDVQARERAWRLGQKKEVTIYRLMSAGTIEEKIYHRQIFKQFLSDKVMKDPKQRQAFNQKDLFDLFTLGNSEDGETETSTMFGSSNANGAAQPDRPSFTKSHTFAGEKTGVQLVQKPQIATGGLTPVKKEPESDDEAILVDDDEIRRIAGVAKLDDYHNEEEENKDNQTDDQRLMEGIFKSSGIHSVLEHDQIMGHNGKPKVSPDKRILEREAQKIAKEAADELKRAAKVAQETQPGTVTWTGEVGSAGRPANIRRGQGPSSASVLAGLAARQPGSSTNSSRASTPTPSAVERRNLLGAKDFIRMIPNFIRRQPNGQVPSAMLTQHFSNMCKTDKQSQEFKAALNIVAEMKSLPGYSAGSSRVRWELRDEYKTDRGLGAGR